MEQQKEKIILKTEDSLRDPGTMSSITTFASYRYLKQKSKEKKEEEEEEKEKKKGEIKI